MNRIILAYSKANAELAQTIDTQLSRIGIPFEHCSTDSGNLAKAILTVGEPVLLLVTDNLLKERDSMEGLLSFFKLFPPNVSIVPVLADGFDEDGKPVETKLDRMVNMLHYMNYWQNAWLGMSDKAHAKKTAVNEAIEAELDAVRAIANETSDIITAIRDREPIELAALEAKDFELFFKKFELSDWHGQYKLLARKGTEANPITEPVLLPESPLSSGLLAPAPVEEPLIEEKVVEVPETTEETIPPAEIIEAAPPIVLEEKTTVPLSQVEQTVEDARLWIRSGHLDRGIELLKIAREEYPDNDMLASAYKSAISEAGLKEEPATPVAVPKEAEQNAETGTSSTEDDIRSYDLMGDIASEKGDYLFAKYCWDRVAELNPGYAGIFRKLGVMTAEHLQDDRETAIQYLEKALEIDPKDELVQASLEDLLSETKKQVKKQAPEIIESTPVLVEPVVETAPEAPQGIPGTVLITGATSGIGRATAELFAKNGYRLILTGRREERLVELKKHFEMHYKGEVLILPFDVRNHGAVKAALDNLPANFKEIDILVNNAGLAKGLAPIQEGTLEHWETMIDTNVKGLLYVTRCIAPNMVAKRHGHIINVGSSAGKEVYPNGNVYCATKFAVDALTRAIRLDLHAHNIRVSQVSPGHVEETEFAVTRFDGDVERAKIYNDFQPLKSTDVAEVIYFMVTRPAHVNIQDVQLFGTQQASSTVIDRSGR